MTEDPGINFKSDANMENMCYPSHLALSWKLCLTKRQIPLLEHSPVWIFHVPKSKKVSHCQEFEGVMWQ